MDGCGWTDGWTDDVPHVEKKKKDDQIKTTDDCGDVC